MHSTGFAASLLAMAAFISSAMASPIFGTRSTAAKRASSQPSLAVYWGQGPDQNRLTDFCQDTTMDIIPIGFVNIFPDQTGGPGTNYGNACGSVTWKSPNGTQTNVYTTCDEIAADVAVCQGKGKKILASIGGEASGNFIATTNSAKSFADFLWGSFGPVQDPTLVQFPRPFGDTVVDGFDLDIESGGDFGYADLVNELRANFAEDSSKTYIISAAPQCVVPDAHLDDAIQHSMIDYLFIQYYNTDQCSAASLFSSGSLDTTADPTFGWAKWLHDNSLNGDIKMFLGLPASTTAANPNHYLDLDQAQALIEEYACTSPYQGIFAGVMLWEATYSENNQINGQSYAANIKDIFGQLSCAPPTTSSTTSSSTTTTTSTTTESTTSTTTTTTITTTTTTTSTIGAPLSTSSSTTSSSAPESPVTTTSSTTSAPPVPTTSSETTTTTTYSHPLGPVGETTSSSSITTTSSQSLSPVAPTSLPPSSSTTAPAGTTSSYSHSHGSYSHSHGHGPSTTSSVYVSPATTSSASVAYTGWQWGDWTSVGSSPVADATTTSGYDSWEDWSATTSTTSSPAGEYTVTVWTTEYTDIGPSGFTKHPFHWTTSVPVAAATTTAPFVWPTQANGCPNGFTTTVTVCSVCAPTVTTVTLTVPAPTATAVMTQTVVPVAPSGAAAAPLHPSGTAETSVAAASVSSWTYSQPAGGAASTATASLSPVAAASTSPGSNSGWLAPSPSSSASASSTPVAPLNVTPFTGGATVQTQLPGTMLSVVICAAIAVGQLFL
ncbi:uncharacterized protein Z520_10093 [Fonsecaea multimorphosa CBS 102226]|uniref:chitinase n=1 Tax=Fonsecaea multimorphosa CBS 102226 TaxID=1442371 RepID=A0A0D2JLA4_9EURO|nr:uncharacterized protein Z520_10093 [Fonsecaea multimorphosa CBS 102226]KIX94067.1 hypothetical protein Z520_10093 [Fonsecaea multimorphosa CBS 102226]